MSDAWPPNVDVFDRSGEVLVVQRTLPHWSQAGTLCFLTFRTHDSIPSAVLKRWHADRRAWLRKHGIDPEGPWQVRLEALDRRLKNEFVRTFSERWHEHLDACHGACVLREPGIAKIVADSLHHFDDQRYVLTDFVVMPNHVHVLAAFHTQEDMLDQCESWKRFTARGINQALASSGRFWQQDGFDHLIRTAEQFFRVRRYIEANPRTARVPVGQYLHYSKPLPRRE